MTLPTLPSGNTPGQNNGFVQPSDPLTAALKKAARLDLEHSGKERKEVAELTEMDMGFLSRCLSDASPVTLPSRQAILWTLHVGSGYAHTLASLAGGCFTRPEGHPVESLHKVLASANLEASLLVQAHAEALAGDGVVDDNERAQLHAHALRLLDQVQGLVEATKHR